MKDLQSRVLINEFRKDGLTSIKNVVKDKILEMVAVKIFKSEIVLGYVSADNGNKVAEVRLIIDCNASLWRGKQPPKAEEWVEV